MGHSDHPDRRRDDAGRFGAEYDDAAFLAAVDDLDHATTSAVAAAVGCDRRTAHYRLTRLSDADRVMSASVGNALLWAREGE